MEGSSNEIIPGAFNPELKHLDPLQISLEDNSNVSSNKRNSNIALISQEFDDESGKNFEATNMEDLFNDLLSSEKNLNTNSNLEIPTPLCNNTLEEVLGGIIVNGSLSNHNANANNNNKNPNQGQQTSGEMSLEDFLVTFGVVQEGSALIRRPIATQSYQNSYGGFPNNNGLSSGAPVHTAYTSSRVITGEGSNSIGMNLNYAVVEISGNNKGEENRRPSTDREEITLERKRHRMIKNRESAARSRARKNAHTRELEHRIDDLKKKNAMLKLSLAESENKRKLEVLNDQASTKAGQGEKKSKTMRKSLSIG